MVEVLATVIVVLLAVQLAVALVWLIARALHFSAPAPSVLAPIVFLIASAGAVAFISYQGWLPQ
jgi:uncharacterized membrane protein YjgN (DUF898 family)